MDKTVQGLEDYSYDEVIDLINDFIIDKIWDSGHSADDIKLNDIRLHGSRLRSQAKSTSDLDAVVEYDGDIREDDFFSILNDDPLYIDDIRVDINPIKEDMDLYMKRSADYDRHKLGLEYRLRKLEQLICEGKHDQEVLRDFLGDEYYDKYTLIKNKIKDSNYKDIYKLIRRDPDEVKAYIDSFKSNRDRNVSAKQSGAKLLYSDNEWNVYKITTYDAAVIYGKNTKWCITGRYPQSEGKGEYYFNNYIESENLDGGYYFFISKNDATEKYCVLQDVDKHIQSIWDSADNDLGDTFAKAYIKNGVILPTIDEIPESTINNDNIDAVKMQDAIDNNDTDLIEQLVHGGIDPNIIVEDQMTALTYACLQSADEYVIQKLIDLGADVNGANSKQPPLLIMSQFNDLIIGDLLIENGADVDLTDESGDTPLYNAIIRGYFDFAELLIEAGANTDFNINNKSLYDYLKDKPKAKFLYNLISKENKNA